MSDLRIFGAAATARQVGILMMGSDSACRYQNTQRGPHSKQRHVVFQQPTTLGATRFPSARASRSRTGRDGRPETKRCTSHRADCHFAPSPRSRLTPVRAWQAVYKFRRKSISAEEMPPDWLALLSLLFGICGMLLKVARMGTSVRPNRPCSHNEPASLPSSHPRTPSHSPSLIAVWCCLRPLACGSAV